MKSGDVNVSFACGDAVIQRVFDEAERKCRANLRDFAGLSKDVAVVGCNNHAEFWDAARWTELGVTETTPENIAAVMEELEF